VTKVIGLTGGIGSGKSTVAKYLAELGAKIIDSDDVGHDAFLGGSPMYDDVVAEFGKGILGPDGEIDRKKLGAVVFNDRPKLDRLNNIMWPRMKEMVRRQIADYRRQGVKAVVVEVPLLIESGWTDLVEEVWVVVASEATVVRRLKEQRKQSEEETLRRIRSQLSNEERIKRADIVIHNDGTPEEMKAKVREAWKRGA
jgi:dephospho-CoA kinase